MSRPKLVPQPDSGNAGSYHGVGKKAYTVRQLSEELGCSYTRARRLALDEAGTLQIPSKGGQRSMIRIPADVKERILRKYSIPTMSPAVSSSQP